MPAPRDPVRNRQAILRAAFQLLPVETPMTLADQVALERAVTVGAIAEAAGVSQGTVHGHFGSRDDLVVAVAFVRSLPGDPGAQINAYLAEHYVKPEPRRGSAGPRPKARQQINGRYVDAECVVCGTQFPTRKRRDGSVQDVCSSACTRTRWAENGGSPLRKSGPRCKYPSCDKVCDAECAVCETPIHRHRDKAGRLLMTCSRECGVIWRRETGSLPADWPSSPVWYRDCEECGTLFVARSMSVMRCDRGECRQAQLVRLHEAHRAQARERYRSDPEYRAKMIADVSAAIMRRYRSDPAFRDRMISASQNRRASALGLEGITQPREVITFLLERDPCCGICGGDEFTESGPQMPSMDHVIPLVRGGAHTINNLQLAHYRCNLSKNDRPLPSVLGYPGELAAA